MGPESAEAAVDALIVGAQKALVLRAFVVLGVAEHLADSELSLAELSRAVDAPRSSVSRFMRAVVALGLCEEVGPGQFRLAVAGALLRRAAAGNAAGWAELMTAPWMLAAWASLGQALRADNTCFSDVHGIGFWDYVAQHPREADVFDSAMTSGAEGRARDLLDAIDWSTVQTVVDVGGGQGRLLASVLAQQHHVRGVVIDRPEVVAAPAAETGPVAERLEMSGGDFFTAVPEGADVYVLSRIVHDWPDRDAVAILRSCRAGMRAAARICLLEQIAPDFEDAPPEDRLGLALKDLNMLVLVGGRERTIREYASLLETADLKLDKVHNGATCSVIQAVVPD